MRKNVVNHSYAGDSSLDLDSIAIAAMLNDSYGITYKMLMPFGTSPIN